MMFRSSIGTGCPIRRSPVQRLLATSPRLFAGCYVLHRLLMSRHPPFALNFYLTTRIGTTNFNSDKILVFLIKMLGYLLIYCQSPDISCLNNHSQLISESPDPETSPGGGDAET